MGNGLSLYRCPNSVDQLESRGLHGSCFLKVFRIIMKAQRLGGKLSAMVLPESRGAFMGWGHSNRFWESGCP